VSSIHGSVAHPRVAAYASSKGGLELLTRSLAVEWAADGIRVNALAPGYLETEMTRDLLDHDRLRTSLLDRIPLRRFGSVGEVAPAVRFLVSGAASYVTGCT
jgi:NAD(P)-dependent dehydrogenase (short-subunit alcohol dehydrogenase family)